MIKICYDNKKKIEKIEKIIQKKRKKKKINFKNSKGILVSFYFLPLFWYNI